MDNAFLRSFLIRDDNPYGFTDPSGQVFSAAIRSWIINEHLTLAFSSPWTGVGTFDLRMIQSGYGTFDNMATGFEAYLTGMFARIGLPMLIFLYAIFFGRRYVPEHLKDMTRCMKLFLFLAMITYGSFIAPYDFIFLLMILAVSGGLGFREAPVQVVQGRKGDAGPVMRPA